MSTVELVTQLADTTIELAVVERAALPDGSRIADATLIRADGTTCAITAAPLRIPYGRGFIQVRRVEQPRRGLPHRPPDVRAVAFLVASLSLHLVILAIAEPAPRAPELPAPVSGTQRPRLVANHTSAARGRPAPVTMSTLHDRDVDGVRPVVDTSPAIEAGIASQKPDLPKARSSAPGSGVDLPEPQPQEAARHFDPCANGDCGLIATGRFATTSNDSRSGADYQLAPRVPHELLQSVVTCEVGGGCSTVSGQDQGEIRGEIARHVSELNACFGLDGEAKVAVDIAFDEHGVAHVSAHDHGRVGDCIATVIERLALPSGEHSVTIAFAR